VERSKKIDQYFFDQKVMLDPGWNVTFSGGFAIQQNFSWLTNVPPESVVEKSHNMELYLEADDFDAFLTTLQSHPEIVLVHPPKKYDWQQRVIRIYDPDFHIIEVGESSYYGLSCPCDEILFPEQSRFPKISFFPPRKSLLKTTTPGYFPFLFGTNRPWPS
jgi:hypothetical protein